MYRFENKTILIISPQQWDHLKVSKHHYAIALAEKGNTVYFLEPPDDSAQCGVSVRPCDDNSRIKIVRYRPSFPFVIRFHARILFDWLMKWQVVAIRAAIGVPVDVVWCFEFNLFSDLKAFGAQLSLFHPVDPLSERSQVEVARSADVVFSVSQVILANFREIGVPAWFINHGLSKPFEASARRPIAANVELRERPRVGYAGNLLRGPLNRPVLRAIIERNRGAEYHFWGPSDAPPDAGSSIVSFISFLRQQPHVQLHGQVTPAQLATELQLMDCFLLSYSPSPRESDRSNSHKILEYLSTGKVTVSSQISTYADRPDLLRMPSDADDSKLPELVRDTLERLEEFNAPTLQRIRRNFALDNTYERQLARIEAKL